MKNFVFNWKMDKMMYKTLLLFIFLAAAFTLFAQDDAYLTVAEVMPTPVGGLEGIYKNLEYPDRAKKAGVKGKVYVLAYINENGGVDDVKVVRGIGAGCDEAAISAIKKSKFVPGKNNGAPVKIKFAVAINFQLTS